MAVALPGQIGKTFYRNSVIISIGSTACGCTRNTKKALKKNEVADLKGLLFLAQN